MKKKGFTLIELLAVIVILAIIALIAMPLVLNTIDKAKQGAAKASALEYMNAVERYMVEAMLDTTMPQLQPGVEYQLTSAKYEVAVVADPNTTYINDLVSIKGDKPTSGYLVVNNQGIVEEMEMIINKYSILCQNSDCEVVDGEYESYNVADAVTIDGVGYHVIKSSNSNQEYVTLLRDESIGDFVFDENGGTNYETSTIKAYLEGTYKDTFGDKKSLIKEVTLIEFGEYEKINNAINNLSCDFTVEGTYLYLFKNYRNVFFEVEMSNDNLYIPVGFLTKTADDSWIITAASELLGGETTTYSLWMVQPNGCGAIGGSGITGNVCENGGTAIQYPVRPVITISKSAIN